MTHFTKLATGLTGLAALAAVSSPAGAQMNPYGYGNNGGAVIVRAVTGYGHYPKGNSGYEQMGQRNSVEMCARTAEQRLNSDRRNTGYNSRSDANNGYRESNDRNGGAFRVVGITNVERRMNGALRVRGIASSGSGTGANGRNDPRGVDEHNAGNGYADRQGHGVGNGYSNNGYRSAGMDYRFSCAIDSRGAVTSLYFDHGTRSARS